MFSINMPTSASTAVAVGVTISVVLFIGLYWYFTSRQYIAYNKIPDISHSVIDRADLLRVAEDNNMDFLRGRENAANLQNLIKAVEGAGGPNGAASLNAFRPGLPQ